jgi:hypothetical protein
VLRHPVMILTKFLHSELLRILQGGTRRPVVRITGPSISVDHPLVLPSSLEVLSFECKFSMKSETVSPLSWLQDKISPKERRWRGVSITAELLQCRGDCCEYLNSRYT